MKEREKHVDEKKDATTPYLFQRRRKESIQSNIEVKKW